MEKNKSPLGLVFRFGGRKGAQNKSPGTCFSLQPEFIQFFVHFLNRRSSQNAALVKKLVLEVVLYHGTADGPALAKTSATADGPAQNSSRRLARVRPMRMGMRMTKNLVRYYGRGIHCLSFRFFNLRT